MDKVFIPTGGGLTKAEIITWFKDITNIDVSADKLTDECCQSFVDTLHSMDMLRGLDPDNEEWLMDERREVMDNFADEHGLK